MAENEVLILDTNPERAQFILKRIGQHRHSFVTPRYTGKGKNLVLWGYGGKVQQAALKAHRAKRRNVIILDIGYFGRDYEYRRSCARLSINEFHPQNWVKYAPESKDRWVKNKIKMLDTYDPNGHVLLCGLGRKSRAFYGFNGMEWEVMKAREIREAYPENSIAYRPKPRGEETIANTIAAYGNDIKFWLKKCSLVVSTHSNTSVDACIHNIPAICTDGIGAAVYPSDIKEKRILTQDQRLDFLGKVSWFNWSPDETIEMMKFANQLIEAKGND